MTKQKKKPGLAGLVGLGHQSMPDQSKKIKQHARGAPLLAMHRWLWHPVKRPLQPFHPQQNSNGYSSPAKPRGQPACLTSESPRYRLRHSKWFSCLHLQNKFVHHRFDNNGIFKHQDCTDQIVRAPRQIFESPKVRVIFEARITRINDHKQFIHRDGTLSHSHFGMLRQHDKSLKTHTEH